MSENTPAPADDARKKIKRIIDQHVIDCLDSMGVTPILPRHSGPAADAILTALAAKSDQPAVDGTPIINEAQAKRDFPNPDAVEAARRGVDLAKKVLSVQPAPDGLAGELGHLLDINDVDDREPDGALEMPIELLKRILTALSSNAGAGLLGDKERLDWLISECADVRWISEGDDSVGLQIIKHHMAEPRERVVAENWHEDLRGAIDKARIDAQLEGRG